MAINDISANVVIAAAALLWGGLSPAQAASSGKAGKAALLLDPSKSVLQAPKEFKVAFKTTNGTFTVDFRRDWAPLGVDRVYNLVKDGFFAGDAFFRVVPGFVVQFGLNGSPQVNAAWRQARIQDDPPTGHSNKRGTIVFATAGPGTRTTQLFINLADNPMLDSMGFVPLGEVVGNGMDTVRSLFSGYGDGPPQGVGPNQGQIVAQGNAYLKKDFPKLDYIKTARIVK
jgi:peptidyl-prolyl cis-trans isomerase A (cyclophilin A)